MNSALKAAILNPHSHLIHQRAALFHSTPVLERKRRNYWQSSRSNQYSNPYSKRFRNLQSKKTLLRNIKAYADHLFQDWKDEVDEGDPSSSGGTSWFKKQYSKKATCQGRQHWDKRGFPFVEDEVDIDVDIESIFESAFGQNRHFYWSFIHEENTRWKSSSSYGNKYWNSGNRRFRVDEDYESSTESEYSDSDMVLDRQALGLSASGPLNLEDVKNAYRTCALKWHPDRHQGSSKAVAEEKFKLCSAAYQSLCDKMFVN